MSKSLHTLRCWRIFCWLWVSNWLLLIAWNVQPYFVNGHSITLCWLLRCRGENRHVRSKCWSMSIGDRMSVQPCAAFGQGRLIFFISRDVKLSGNRSLVDSFLLSDGQRGFGFLKINQAYWVSRQLRKMCCISTLTLAKVWCIFCKIDDHKSLAAAHATNSSKWRTQNSGRYNSHRPILSIQRTTEKSVSPSRVFGAWTSYLNRVLLCRYLTCHSWAIVNSVSMSLFTQTHLFRLKKNMQMQIIDQMCADFWWNSQ